MATDSYATAVAAAPPLYVGFWARVFASIVDTILSAILIVVVSLLIFGSARNTPGFVGIVVEYFLPAGVVLLFWIRRQATPGKIMIHARIVDAKTGADPEPWQYVVRYLGYYVSLLTLGLGFLWVAFDRRKQGLHDKLASTVVVRELDPLLDSPTRAVG